MLGFGSHVFIQTYKERNILAPLRLREHSTRVLNTGSRNSLPVSSQQVQSEIFWEKLHVLFLLLLLFLKDVRQRGFQRARAKT